MPVTTCHFHSMFQICKQPSREKSFGFMRILRYLTKCLFRPSPVFREGKLSFLLRSVIVIPLPLSVKVRSGTESDFLYACFPRFNWKFMFAHVDEPRNKNHTNPHFLHYNKIIALQSCNQGLMWSTWPNNVNLWPCDVCDPICLCCVATSSSARFVRLYPSPKKKLFSTIS